MELSPSSYNLLDTVSVGICIIDSDYIVQFWNEYLEDYTGIKKDDIHRKKITDFLPGFSQEIYKERIDRIFEGWAPVILSSRLHEPFFVSKDNGVKRFQEISISPYSSNESDRFLAVLTVTDVTYLTNKLDEQKELYSQIQTELEIRTEIQDKLRLSESNLRALNATKDKFFSIIAHDLRNPVASIINFSDLICMNISKYSTEQLAEYIKIINTTSESTIELLDNLLLWSSMQTGKLTFKPSFIELNKVILQIIEILKTSASLKNIALNHSYNEYMVYADSNMLKTIIRNLLQNAIKFTNTGGEVKIYSITKNGNIEITISDNGIGMSNEAKSKLFLSGETQSGVGTAGERGSGLGLVLCKEFAEIHSGLISCQSNEGIGTQFTLSLPLKPFNI